MSFASRPKRPASELIHFPRLVTPGLMALVFLAGACNPKSETQPDNWRLTPPRLISSDEKGMRISTALDRFGTVSSISVGASAILEFADSDRGLPLRFESQCGEERHEGKMATGPSISIARLMPPLTLSKLMNSDLSNNTVCHFDFKVTNSAGSSHQFVLEQVSVGRFSPSKSKVQARALGRLRLICPDWWVEESEPSAGDLTPRVEVLANSHSVNGIDSRLTRRRPNCAVANLTPDGGFEQRGHYSPRYERPSLRVIPTALTSSDSGGFFLQRPFIKWNIQNRSATDIVIFVAVSNLSAQVSHAVALEGADKGWNRAVQTPITLVDSAPQSRNTSAGRYMRVSAFSQIEIQMNFNRRAWCIVEFGNHWSPGFFAQFSKPIIAQSLAMDVTESEFQSLSDFALDSVPRDEQVDHLIESVAVSVTKNGSTIAGTKRTDLDIARAGFKHQDLDWFGCYEGTGPMEGPLVTY